MENYGTHRPEIITVNTTFGVGSGDTFRGGLTGKYNNMSFIAQCNSGDATLDIRFAPNSGFTMANCLQLALSDGITAISSIRGIVGHYVDVTVSAVNSAASVALHGYGVQV